jgi:hypothetical protein
MGEQRITLYICVTSLSWLEWVARLDHRLDEYKSATVFIGDLFWMCGSSVRHSLIDVPSHAIKSEEHKSVRQEKGFQGSANQERVPSFLSQEKSYI